MMTANRALPGGMAPLLAVLLALAGCEEPRTGPLRVVAIGSPPALVNPNLEAVDPASALLLETAAQGLVRFNAAGEIEPALAQSWIVSDDGRRYTFRLRPAEWANGEPVEADDVAARLQAATSRASRNALKPVLGTIEQIEAMTDEVLEIELAAPRPNFLQLLAQPEMAVLREGAGTGPYRLAGEVGGAVRLVPPPPDEDEELAEEAPDILLRAAPAPVAIARFLEGQADLVVGGTTGTYPLLAAADLPDEQIVIDPARGLLGLQFLNDRALLEEPGFRQALAMAVDREGIVGRFGIPGLEPRTTILPPGVDELPATTPPDWAGVPLPARREVAARIVAGLVEDERPTVRVALPEGPGYRIIFAHLKRDWSFIGVDAEAAEGGTEADLRLIDVVAPADLGTWYLRPFMCGTSAICDEDADLLIEVARTAPTPQDRQANLAEAHAILTGLTAFIPIASPVRWSLRNNRLPGFRANRFARHTLIDMLEAAQAR